MPTIKFFKEELGITKIMQSSYKNGVFRDDPIAFVTIKSNHGKVCLALNITEDNKVNRLNPYYLVPNEVQFALAYWKKLHLLWDKVDKYLPMLDSIKKPNSDETSDEEEIFINEFVII